MKNKRAGGVIYSVWMVFISIHHVGFVKRGRTFGWRWVKNGKDIISGGGRKGEEGGRKKNIFRNEFVGAGRGYCFLTAGVQQSTEAGGRGPFGKGRRILGVDISPLHFHYTCSRLNCRFQLMGPGPYNCQEAVAFRGCWLPIETSLCCVLARCLMNARLWGENPKQYSFLCLIYVNHGSLHK